MGARAYGCVNSIRDYGVFVNFFGDMHGLAHVSELGLDPDVMPAEAFSIGQVHFLLARLCSDRVLHSLSSEVGWGSFCSHALLQVVKTRVLSADAGKKRIELSLMSKKQAEKRALAEAALSPGEAFTGIVRAVKTGEAGASAAVLSVDLMDGKRRVGSGQLEATHLSDHPSGAEALMDVIQVGRRVLHRFLHFDTLSRAWQQIRSPAHQIYSLPNNC